MPSEAEMTVSITFQSPHEGTHGAVALHERQIEAVPKSEAKQMAQDFTNYQRKGQVDQRKLYRYDSGDGERLVALDFEEVVAVIASAEAAS